MTDPNLIVHQRLNSAALPRFITDIRVIKDMLYSVNGLSALIPGGEIILEKTRARVKNRTLIEGDWFISTSSICVSKDGVWLGIGQRENGLAIWLLRYEDAKISDARELGRFSTSGSVNACVISSEHFLALALCENRVDRIDLGTRRVVEPIELGYPANCLAVDEYAGTVITGGQSINVWSLSGRAIAQIEVETPVKVITTAEIEEAIENRFFVTGHSNGIVRFWMVNFATMELECLKSIKPTTAPIRRIAIDEEAIKVILVSEEDIFSIDYLGSSAVGLRTKYAIECSNCFKAIEKGSAITQGVKICSSCHRFFCQDCLSSEGVCSNCLSMRDYRSGNQLDV
jgi:hypothetical protein